MTRGSARFKNSAELTFLSFKRDKQGQIELGVGEWDERVAWSKSRSEKVFPRGQPVLMRTCMRDQDEGGPKFRILREGEKLDQILVNQHFVLIDLWK